MISNIIDWGVDCFYEFKWLVEDAVSWGIEFIKTLLQELSAAILRIRKLK